MPDDAELEEIRARSRQAKKALKTLGGQMRMTIQLLADLDERIHAFTSRQETTAPKEAQDHDHSSRDAELVA